MRNERGQASIMIAMMMLTFIMFFAFVVNTGMLVNAKINLQNAADMAAYAGAATQARQLNSISYINYEMRRQYKKFLFRYYVMGNMAQAPFPRSPAGQAQTPMTWSPDGKKNYQMPVVCMIFNAADDFCQLPSLPPISIPPANPFDAVSTTLNQALKKMEDTRQGNCQKIGKVNKLLLLLWLWNVDPALTELAKEGLDDEQKANLNVLKGLGSGIGLIPREILLRMRIKTLEEYVNTEAQTNVGLEKAETLKASDKQAALERTIQAFFSAYYTLGNHTFPADSIVMDEMIPEKLLKLEDIKAKFDAYAVDFEIVNNVCTPRANADGLAQPMPLGVYKDPKFLTYYAIRLKAKANLLFSPFGALEMKAYAAAQPFGSRIGPVLTDEYWLRNSPTDALAPSAIIPNLPVRQTETKPEMGTGWDTKEVMGQMVQGFAAENGSMPANLGIPDIEKAYWKAMVPNPWEVRQYNIINDDPQESPNNEFMKYFDSRHSYVFWAPLVSPEKVGNLESEVRTRIDELFQSAADNAERLAFKKRLEQEMLTYLGKVRKGQGDDDSGFRDGFNLVHLPDPFYTRPVIAGGQFTEIKLPPWIMTSNRKELRTSWKHPLFAPRVGYSVKFVPFRYLKRASESAGTSNGKDPWTNTTFEDAEAESDIQAIEH